MYTFSSTQIRAIVTPRHCSREPEHTILLCCVESIVMHRIYISSSISIIVESISTDKYFSAVCWVYGRILNKRLGYPIGLVESAVGGSLVECWSSAQALKQCQHHKHSEVAFPKM